MTIELTYLTGITLFTALMWMPYMLNVVAVRGIKDTVGYPNILKPVAPWAARLGRAHVNAVENLAIFAPLVLIAQLAGVSNEITALACIVYFWARIAHYFLYAFAVPLAKTTAFVIGFFCQAALVWQLLVA